MSIDPTSERLVSLTEAARTYPWPVRRGGKRLAVATLYRWSLSGCRGIRLETVQVGGTRCTSLEAISRFIAALTAQAGAAETPAPMVSVERERHLAAVAAQLDAAGI